MCRSRRWHIEVVSRVRGISGILGWFCGLADSPKYLRFIMFSDHSEQLEVFAYLDIFGGLEILNKMKKILSILRAPSGRHKMSF